MLLSPQGSALSKKPLVTEHLRLLVLLSEERMLFSLKHIISPKVRPKATYWVQASRLSTSACTASSSRSRSSRLSNCFLQLSTPPHSSTYFEENARRKRWMVVHLCHCNLKSGEALRSCPGYCGTVAPRHHAKVGEGGVVDQAIILGENLLLRLFSKKPPALQRWRGFPGPLQCPASLLFGIFCRSSQRWLSLKYRRRTN